MFIQFLPQVRSIRDEDELELCPSDASRRQKRVHALNVYNGHFHSRALCLDLFYKIKGFASMGFAMKRVLDRFLFFYSDKTVAEFKGLLSDRGAPPTLEEKLALSGSGAETPKSSPRGGAEKKGAGGAPDADPKASMLAFYLGREGGRNLGGDSTLGKGFGLDSSYQ